jgi:hypothetical protein
MRKLTTMIVMALAMITASVARGDTLTMTPVMLGIGQQNLRFVVGKKYPVVVYLKDHTKRYYAGDFIGYMVVNDPKHPLLPRIDVKPIGKPIQVTTKDKNIAKSTGVYYAFKGEHSTLVYAASDNWLIIESK